jgi:hypothetical protein
MGPEQPLSVLDKQMGDIHWTATGIGYGVRGSNRTDLTLRLEGKMHHMYSRYRDSNQDSPIQMLLNYIVDGRRTDSSSLITLLTQFFGLWNRASHYQATAPTLQARTW